MRKQRAKWVSTHNEDGSYNLPPEPGWYWGAFPRFDYSIGKHPWHWRGYDKHTDEIPHGWYTEPISQPDMPEQDRIYFRWMAEETATE